MIKRKSNLYLEAQYKEQGEHCYYCKDKTPFDYITRDHFAPISGGNTLVDNKIFACRICNTMKGNKSIDEFKASVTRKCIDILRIVVDNNWMISDDQVNRFKKYVVILNTLAEIQKNDYKPTIMFT
jgi:hypothetical protein